VTSLQLFPTKWKSYYGNNGKPLNHKVYFSNKEKAKEYILLNKPVLSLNDYINTNPLGGKHTIDKLTKLVKSKIQQSV